MNALKLFLALAMMVMVADSTIVIGGGLALALLGIKAAAWKGVAIGAILANKSRGRSSGRSYRRRWGRSAEDFTEALLRASLNDSEDCAKKMVCQLNAADEKALAQDELAVRNLFGQSGVIDVTAVTAEFDLAALMGKKAGMKQCETIYARCPYQTKDLMEMMRQPNFV